MKKQNMLTYLEKAIPKYLVNKDCALDWDKKNHTIEIVVALFAQNEAEVAITDDEGVTADRIIEFEDGFLFYHPEKSIVDSDDFLQIMPYEGKKGLPAYQLDAVCEYLHEVLEEGESDLLDFVQDPEKTEFGLVWDSAAFEKVLIKHKETGSKDWIGYPSY